MWDVGIGLSAIPTQPTPPQATGQADATPARLGVVWQHQPPVPSLAGSHPVIGLVALDYGGTFAISAHMSLDLVSVSGQPTCSPHQSEHPLLGRGTHAGCRRHAS